MEISDVQAGRIGEYLLAVYSMLTSDGALVPFQVDADDDHRDLVVAVKGKSTFASLQAKACFQLGESGFVQSNATYFEKTIPRDPSWIYVIVLVLDLAPVVWWLVPAPDFNRLTSRAAVARSSCTFERTRTARMHSRRSALRRKMWAPACWKSSTPYRPTQSHSQAPAWCWRGGSRG